jgi:Helix-turn-helix domain
VLIAETGPVSERVRVREVDDDEGRRLVRIVRRGSGSVVTWRRAQMVLLSAQGMDAAAIARVAFTSEDRVRDVIRNFNADGFDSLYPKYGLSTELPVSYRQNSGDDLFFSMTPGSDSGAGHCLAWPRSAGGACCGAVGWPEAWLVCRAEGIAVASAGCTGQPSGR